MKNETINKLIFIGKANFNQKNIVKLTTESNEDNNFDDLGIVINKDNIKDYKKFKDYPLFLLSGDILKEQNKIIKYFHSKNIFFTKENLSFLNKGDIVELDCKRSGESRLFIIYRINSDDNTLIPTNACNCNCIMCPIPIFCREDKVDTNIGKFLKIISLIDKKTKFLGISGGEPTILKDKLIEILSYCKRYLPNTGISLLTNGRMFYYKSFVDAIDSVGLKNIDFCIPLYSNDYKIHDEITAVKGSFSQTVQGIKNLLSKNQSVELRIVMQKKNYKDLEKIVDFIIENFPNIFRISFMGLEFLGKAVINYDKIWISYNDLKNNIQKSSIKLLKNGFKVYIYNFPMCKLDEPFRNLCVKSISDYKVRYLNECNKCAQKKECGGTFLSNLNKLREEGVEPIK